MARMKKAVWLTALIVAAGITIPAHAGITFVETMNGIWVIDYPAGFPCTMKRIKAADEMNGWEKVLYEEASDTYTLKCNLLIGTNDGAETYVQVGTKDSPNETVVMQGNVYVFPFFVAGENEGLYYQVPILANRLTLGSPGDPHIKAALKFDSSKAGEFGLTVGRFPAAVKKTGKLFGGQFHAYNSVVTALKQEKATACAGFAFSAQEIVLQNAELSWSAGLVADNLSGIGIANSVFAHGKAAVTNGNVKFAGCTLRNLNFAVLDCGAINATFTDCTFKDNEHNWSLRSTPRGVTLIDCTVGEPTKGDIFTAPTAMVASKRHVIVEVVGPDGKPAPGARIVVKCEQDIPPEMVENWKQTTDAAGRTPAKGGKKPVLLTEYTKKTTSTPNQPEFKEYTYAIEVEAQGHANASVAGVKPDESWKVVRVQLK